MIIQVRGTSGSGKTTVMRELMRRWGGEWIPAYVPGRRRPLYLSQGNVVVMGHYDIPCGGCDTIGSVPQVFNALESVPPGAVVLMEGLLVSEDVIWLSRHLGSKAAFLATPPLECLERVGQRQRAKGRPPADPERVKRKLLSRAEQIDRARLRLLAAGFHCPRVSCEQAVPLMMRWLDEAMAGAEVSNEVGEA